MKGELVAIDLETTGLDPLHDAIIEIGAVRLIDGQVVDEFSALINPNRPIPQLVTGITGISNDDVAAAPSITTVLPALRAFIGRAPLIGHNIGFDAAFLLQQGIGQNNPRIDTYDMASILLPRAARYSLGSLTAQIGINLENAHRALDDARATGLLYWLLWQKLLELPFATLYEINEASQDLTWESRVVFDAAVRERLNSGERPTSTQVDIVELFGRDTGAFKSLKPNETPGPIDDETAVALIDDGGALSTNLPGYEHRAQQIEMTRAIVEAFNNNQDLLVEAGTGTGKSIAYLVPSILWSTQNNERVVVSTNTINLQDQLITKDIPTLQLALGIPFRASVMKGRGNYLCPRRLIAVRRRRPTSVDELRTLSKILVWLLESNTGDRGEISLRGPLESATWQRLSAEDEGCTLDRCRAMMEGACPFYKARKAAEAAQVVVVNHALLVTDAMTESQVLPSYRHLIVDEAHHLEDATTSGLSFRLDEATLRRRLADLGSARRGLLGSLLASVRSGAPERDVAKTEQYAELISAAARDMEVHIAGLFAAFRGVVADVTGGRMTDYSTQIRITEPVRKKDSFKAVQSSWATLAEFFEAISQAMRKLAQGMEKLRVHDLPDYDDLINSVSTASRYFDEVTMQLSAIVVEPDANAIYWINLTQDGEFLSVHAAPLHVGPLVDQYLWSAKDTVVMTSATLQTNGSFNYIQERLSGQTVETKEVGSPFDYHESTLLYVANDVPEPTDRGRYQSAVERGLIELAAALDGRVMALFTSYAQLRQTSQAITPRLALGSIAVYDQSDGSSRQALLDGFKATQRAVLLGTRSFWEGVDIPGESLSALVIIRLPFSVPTDPIFAARSETYKNAFNEYALPDAILRFRQGFGRLIRTRTDRGIVAIFDSRIVSKGYGKSFVDALPDCTIQYGSLNDLPTAAKTWLA